MTWYDFSWVPGFWQHEILDVRLVGEVTKVNGRRVAGAESPVGRFVGNFHPVNGEDADKDDEGQKIIGDGLLFTATDLPTADNELEPSLPGARLYHHGRMYEFVHKEWWGTGAYYKYTLRLRTRWTPEPPPPGGGGGG